ncbi:MAG: hypothetical protein WCB46_05985 [Methanoregula sp.]
MAQEGGNILRKKMFSTEHKNQLLQKRVIRLVLEEIFPPELITIAFNLAHNNFRENF